MLRFSTGEDKIPLSKSKLKHIILEMEANYYTKQSTPHSILVVIITDGIAQHGKVLYLIKLFRCSRHWETGSHRTQ